MFIPIVGPIVIYGYYIEVIECLHREQGRRYPDFDFNRFGELLSRGVWVFLAYLIFSIVMVPLMWVMIVGGMALVGLLATAAGPDLAPVALAVGIPLFVILVAGVSILTSMILIPSMLRVGMTQDLGQGFNLSFTMEFVRNTWFQAVISSLFFYFFSMAVSILGLLFFCVGVYAAASYLGLVMTHIAWQLYELHLSRGGASIPLKTPVETYPPVK